MTQSNRADHLLISDELTEWNVAVNTAPGLHPGTLRATSRNGHLHLSKWKLMLALRRNVPLGFLPNNSALLCLFLLLGSLLFPTQNTQAAPFSEPMRPATFDLKAARRTDDLQVEVRSTQIESAPSVRVKEIRFSSTSWDENGVAKPIRIQAFVAIPVSAESKNPSQTKLPGLVSAHGLGSQADPRDIAELARNLNVVALSLSAPGSGESEGEAPTPQDPRPIFRTEKDLRASWLYQYVFAILRAVTYLGTLPFVDPKGVVVTGFSMGGIATFIVGGTDDRVRAVMPVAASGGLASAAEAETWWRRLILSANGMKPSDPGPRVLFRRLDPLAFAPIQKGALYMLAGAQDEFFPLSEMIRTYKAVRASAKTLAIVADYDHGWYFGAGCPADCMPKSKTEPLANPPAHCATFQCPSTCAAEPPYCGPEGSYNRHADFLARRSLLLRALIAQFAAHPKRAYSAAPPTPFVQRVREQVVVRVMMDPPPKAVRLAISQNGGYTFGQYELAREYDGAWHHRKPVSADAILIAEVEASDGAISTSIPVLPRTYRPSVRPFGAPPK